ncbi:hypothetical protein BW686_01820 [Pseudomonas syringae]|uniref:DUF1534 domain-containing protein n=1 Tax=Pseudomonas syringae TaxID=317 RepID=A0A244EY19_PSESX|nr:hypothetical protein BW686_01820 [Pseudomonas syringae]
MRTLRCGHAGRDALRRKEDAERPERHDDAERRTIANTPFPVQSTRNEKVSGLSTLVPRPCATTITISRDARSLRRYS